MRISDWSSNVCYTVLTAQPRIRNCLPSRLSRQCPRTGERSNADLQEQMLSGYLPSRREDAQRNKRHQALKDICLPIYASKDAGAPDYPSRADGCESTGTKECPHNSYQRLSCSDTKQERTVRKGWEK